MDIGIIGLPLAGKTTIFNALTRSQARAGVSIAGRGDTRLAVVEVPDPRIETLAGLFAPRKTTRAKVRFHDISSVVDGRAERREFDPVTLNAMATSDALLMVIRGFQDEATPHPAGNLDPRRDLATLRLELILADLGIVERRIERIRAGLRQTRTAERPMLQHELALMERLQQALEDERLIGDLDLETADRLLIRGYQFLTAKPMLVVVNLGETDDPTPDLSWANHHRQTAALALKGALEMEIAQLPHEEIALFLDSYGIAEPGLNLLVRTCYDLLGLISFFTVGEDEVRAWTLRRGATALEAARTIHSDLARGFIRAEVLPYAEMIACKTLAEARCQGKLRLEGKEYVVQDGEILTIRFNV